MADNIIKFYPRNAAEDPDAVLEQAVGHYQDVFVLGWDKDGHLDARATLSMNAAEILWMLEKFKAKLLAGDYDA